ncbi:MAG: TRAP transporter small permease subunit [Rhizobiaceae bacterium]
MNGVLNKTANRLERALAALGGLCGWLLLLLVVVQFLIVLARYVFAVNFLWLQELAIYLHASIFMLAMGWSLTADKHVRIDIFRERSSAVARRRVDWLGSLFFLAPMMIAIGWTSLPYVAQSWRIYEGSAEISGLPGLYLLKTLLPVFALLMLLAGLVRLVRLIRTNGRST